MSSKYAFTKTLREVRFLFCQTSEHSAAVRWVFFSYRVPPCKSAKPLADAPPCLVACRSFLTRAYPTMKKNNPDIPIMLREAAGTLPRVFARYELGRETSQSLEG